MSFNISLQWDTLAVVNAAWNVILMWAAPWGLILTCGRLHVEGWQHFGVLKKETQNDRLTGLWSLWHKDHYQLRWRWRKNWGQKGTCLVLAQICAIPVETDDPKKKKKIDREEHHKPTAKKHSPYRKALTLLYFCRGLTSLGRKHNYGCSLMC